tara:strand:+ start:447 stop:782 length:336 start_codon:yes stop_codon:yes gene_type:complete
MATYSNLYIDQGSDFNFTVDLTPTVGSTDLTSYTHKGQLRKTYTSTNAIDFAISINNTNKKLTGSLTAAQTGSLKAGRYVYDIEIRSGDATPIITRVVEGQVDITPRVTVA